VTSPARQAFEIYLRTGRRVSFEQKFNPYHDPRNGQFTFAPGGAGSAAASESKALEIGKICGLAARC
jgi:hypothetical protein